MAPARPTFDWEAACNVSNKTQSVKAALQFTLGNLTSRREAIMRTAPQDPSVVVLTSMMAVMETAIGKVALTFGDAQLEQLGQQAHMDAGLIFQHWRNGRRDIEGSSAQQSQQGGETSNTNAAAATSTSTTANAAATPSADLDMVTEESTLAEPQALQQPPLATATSKSDAAKALSHSFGEFMEEFRGAANNRAVDLGLAEKLPDMAAGAIVPILKEASDRAVQIMGETLGVYTTTYQATKQELRTIPPDMYYSHVVDWQLFTRDVWDQMCSELSLVALEGTAEVAVRNAATRFANRATEPQRLLEDARHDEDVLDDVD